MRYRVRFLDSERRVAERRVTAAGPEAALRLLEEDGVTPLAAHPEREWRGSAARRFDTPLFTAQLAALLGAGLNLTEALEALADNEPSPSRREPIDALLRDLRAGHTLSAALAGFPEHFPDLLCACVRAAERTGDLRAALLRFGAYSERSQEVRRRLVTALLYPALVTVVGLLVTGFLLLAVVPRFAAMVTGNGRELPWATQLLFDLSNSLGAHPALWAGTLCGGLAALWLLLTQNGGVTQLLAGLENVPLLGGLLLRQRISRMARALALLLQGGIALSGALEVALPLAGGRRPAQSGQNREAATGPTRSDAVRASLEAGHPLSAALAAAGLATPLSTRLLRVGERSGQLAGMLDQVADFHEAEVTRTVERIARIAEPLLMLALGLLIGGVVLLLYLPIFDLAGGLQ